MIPPYKDPLSTKYPGRRFYKGRWQTEDQIKLAKESSRANYARHIDYYRQWREDHQEESREYKKEWHAEKWRTDPMYRLRLMQNLRNHRKKTRKEARHAENQAA